MEKESKTFRILQLYERLRKGTVINKKDMANELCVTERSIARDIDDIGTFLATYYPGLDILYDSVRKGHYLSGEIENGSTGVELLSISKILLESRALNREEMKGVIQSLLAYSDKDDAKLIKSIVGNELIHYQPLQHNKPLLKMIWELAFCINKKQLLEIGYRKNDSEDTMRIVKPVSIIFSEYYFYLIAFINDSDYQSPAFYRIDRISHFKILNEKFTFQEKNRFEDGELRKRIQFMYAGDLIRLKFKFFNVTNTPVLDRFPNAKIVNKIENGWIVEAEVYGKGCLMWLLSQGERVEIISPTSLREEMKSTIQKMSEIYKDEGSN